MLSVGEAIFFFFSPPVTERTIGSTLLSWNSGVGSHPLTYWHSARTVFLARWFHGHLLWSSVPTEGGPWGQLGALGVRHKSAQRSLRSLCWLQAMQLLILSIKNNQQTSRSCALFPNSLLFWTSSDWMGRPGWLVGDAWGFSVCIDPFWKKHILFLPHLQCRETISSSLVLNLFTLQLNLGAVHQVR